MDEYLEKLQYVLVVLLMIAGCLLLSILLVSGKDILTGDYSRKHNSSIGSFGQQNAVTESVSRLTKGASDAYITITSTVSKTVSSAASVVGNSLSVVGKAIGHVALNIVRAPGAAFGALTHPPSASALIRPETENQTTVPIIKPQILPKSMNTITPAIIEPAQVIVNSNQDSSWPIRGRITTYFGVPHMPYQVTHTGMDIASGHASGVMPIHPFGSGRVSAVIYSSRGLGNHVLIDHGNGITSVYGHMYSISVKENQEVTSGTIVGYEGSTGVSTGTHLHFEIRQNDISVDPMLYVPDRP